VAGYNGKTCEVNIDECASDPCIHNGRCVDLVNGFYCSCTGTGFKGFRCDINVDECATGEHECQNGGVCVDNDGGYSCTCAPDYTGVLCEGRLPIVYEPTASARKQNKQMELGLSIGFVLLVALIATVLLFLYRKKQMSKMSGRYYPSDEEFKGGAYSMIQLEKDERLI